MVFFSNCALDTGRTPTATLVIFERIADLAGEPAIDDRTFADLGELDTIAPLGSVPDDNLRSTSPWMSVRRRWRSAAIEGCFVCRCPDRWPEGCGRSSAAAAERPLIRPLGGRSSPARGEGDTIGRRR